MDKDWDRAIKAHKVHQFDTPNLILVAEIDGVNVGVWAPLDGAAALSIALWAIQQTAPDIAPEELRKLAKQIEATAEIRETTENLKRMQGGDDSVN